MAREKTQPNTPPERAGLSGMARHPERREILLEQSRSRMGAQGRAGLHAPA